MSYKEFLELIQVQVKNRMGKEVRICIHSVIKNNAVTLDGLSILEQGDNVSPAIYLNSFYQDYLTGESIEDIVSKIISCYRNGKKIRHLDTSFYTDFDKAKSRIVCRLIGREANQKLLEEIPYRSFLNLAIVYYYLLDIEEIGSAAILIREEHLKMWKLEEKELYELAVTNMKELLPCEFLSMDDMLRSLTENELWSEKEGNVPLYVLTNKDRNYGAAWITDIMVLSAIGNRVGDDYYILPSSVHECMIVPVNSGADEKILAEMVKEMNQTQVEPEEVLSDTIYRYNREAKEITIVM